MSHEYVNLENDRLPAAETEPSSTAHYWTEDRISLETWLGKKKLSLGKLYHGAVELIYGKRIPGWEWFVCHAVREIRNRLPDAIAGSKVGSLQYANRLNAIAAAWSAAGFSVDRPVSKANIADEPTLPTSADVPLPRNLFTLVAELIQDHHQARERPLEAATRLFEAAAPENAPLSETLRPVMINWLDITAWFVRHVHIRDDPNANPDHQQLTAKFEAFEKVLKALVGEFFAGISDIDEILQDANN